MNSLSWMIYAAGMVSKLIFLLTAIGVFAFIYGMWMYVFTYSLPDRDSHRYAGDDDYDKKVAARVAYRSTAKRILFTGIAMMTASAVLPGSTTIYLIAASEAGETVIQSPEAREVFDDLKTIIKSKLKEQLPKV